ncbi:MAG TPA: serine hydrolase [Brevundimonas sp.]|jgi:CubicO group peptidase (beta-lactamase class C family)|uniref:serine hydrolase domain-containing protein n=1 Tax=Brevundimonas sp. TaxID=1871086 RepID=UPI002E0DCE98|nr:serine hydrolase [Brevundimonas sp.]
MVLSRRAPLLAAALLVLGGSPALAQTPSPAPPPAPRPADLAMAAGYKALMVCGAVFNAREAGAERTVESVEAHELVGIYPELDPLVRDMPAVVGESEVRVAWDAVMPPRLAVHTPGRGCVIAPVGAESLPPRAPVVRAAAPAWPTAAPRGNTAVLETTLAGALGDAYGPGVTTSVVVVQDGRLVAERYREGFGPDTPQRTWSVAKSLAGTLVGWVAHRTGLDVAAPAAIPEWATPGDPRAAITVDQLMRMSSGLTSDTAGNRTDALYFGGVAIAEQTPGWPLIAPPGTRYRYANNDTLLAIHAIAPALASTPPEVFLDRLGMRDTFIETDWRGGYMLSSQVWSTARDLARLGQLYVQDGVWEGQRLLPEDWRAYVGAASGPQPNGALGYGATFWLMNRSEGVPADTLAAQGNRGQYIVIVPSRRIVLVRRGEDPAGRGFDLAAFTRDALAALD